MQLANRNREWYDEVVWLPFENTVIPAPKNYHDSLIRLYGQNYMVPKRYEAHDYPFYKEQEKILMEALGKANKGE